MRKDCPGGLEVTPSREWLVWLNGQSWNNVKIQGIIALVEENYKKCRVRKTESWNTSKVLTDRCILSILTVTLGKNLRGLGRKDIEFKCFLQVVGLSGRI